MFICLNKACPDYYRGQKSNWEEISPVFYNDKGGSDDLLETRRNNLERYLLLAGLLQIADVFCNWMIGILQAETESGMQAAKS